MTIHVPTALLSAVISGILGFSIATALNPATSNANKTPASIAKSSADLKVLKQIRDRLEMIDSTVESSGNSNALNMVVLTSAVTKLNNNQLTDNAAILSKIGTVGDNAKATCKNVAALAVYPVTC